MVRRDLENRYERYGRYNTNAVLAVAAIRAVVAIAIAVVIAWYFFGGGLENKVASDAVKAI
jgi:hypothetical protein